MQHSTKDELEALLELLDQAMNRKGVDSSAPNVQRATPPQPIDAPKPSTAPID